MDEIWKPIIGWDKYEISNMGQVRSGDLILKPQKRNGYCFVYLRKPGVNKKKYRIHRLVGEYFILNDNPDKNHINHIDGNKENNCVLNLEWVSPKENSEHAIKMNLMGRAKPHLNRDNIICDYVNNNLSHRDMSIKYNCSVRTMERILSGYKKRILD